MSATPQNAIFLDSIPASSVLTAIPREPASDPRYIKHVYCDGARFHVLSWSLSSGGRGITRCSEPDCIINKPAAAAEQEKE